MTYPPVPYPYDAPASQALFDRATAVVPGGVNSPVRAFKAVGGTPRFMVSGRGPYLTDADGREYVDLVCSWGPMILGHAHPAVVEALQTAARKGTSYGTPSPGEVELAERIVERVAPVEQVRLVNSGTEATMSALRLARGFTGRSKGVKVRTGCYHGHVDALMAGAGSVTLGRRAEQNRRAVPIRRSRTRGWPGRRRPRVRSRPRGVSTASNLQPLPHEHLR